MLRITEKLDILTAMSVVQDGYPSDKVKKLLRHDEIVYVRESCKMSEFIENSPFSGAGKHPDFQAIVAIMSSDTAKFF